MIPKQNIDKLSARLLKQGLDSAHEVLERDYVQSWILVALCDSKLKDIFAFKGGTALRKIYFPEYRFSFDLDFTYTGREQREKALETIKKEFDLLYAYLKRETNLPCISNRNRDETGEESFTFYINYSGPLGTKISKRDIKINITFGEHIVCGTEEKAILRNYEEYSDLPEDKELRVYSIEEILIEKLCCILDRDRHEPRDIYDLWYLVNEGLVDLGNIKSAFLQKAKHKKTNPHNFQKILKHKEKIYAAHWENRLKGQLPGGHVPPFDGVYREIRRAFKKVT